MTSLAQPLETSTAVLAELRAQKVAEERAEVAQLELAVEFAAFNSAESIQEAATLPGSEGAVPLAGEGAPLVAEFAIAELAAALGRSNDSARGFLAAALELSHRLPLTYREMVAGRVVAWKARQIAERTLMLPMAGAAWVDAQVHAVAGRIGPAQLQRVIDHAIARFDPETAEARALDALESRHFDIHLDNVLDGGLSVAHVDATLDVADALDLEAAISGLAAQLGDLGCFESLDVRRAKAAGELARGQLSLELPADPSSVVEPGSSSIEPDSSSIEPVEITATRIAGQRRQVVLHVHLTDAALGGGGRGSAGLTRVESVLGQRDQTVTVEQVQEWCRTADLTLQPVRDLDTRARSVPDDLSAHARAWAGSDQVRLKPILDLAERIASTGYRPSGRLREQVVHLNPTCVFPYCTRPSRRADLDHVLEYERGGETSSDNLAPLCRYHHRLKTHTRWRYRRLTPGTHLWTSPVGYRYLTDTSGTTDLNLSEAPGFDPPDRPAPSPEPR